MRDLAKDGYVARNRLLDLERAYAEITGSIAENIGNIGRAQRQISELKLRRVQRQQGYQSEVRAQLSDVQKEAEALKARLTSLDFDLENAIVRAPVEGTARGRVVVDVAFAGVGAVERLELTIENGSLNSASGSRAKRVLALIAGPAARLLAEFGIGTNSMAQPGANTLEAEKAVGTVHFGFGDNRSFGGSNAAAGHWDAVLRCRQIELDGQPLALDETVFFDSCGNSSTP